MATHSGSSQYRGGRETGRQAWGTVTEYCFHPRGPFPVQILEYMSADAIVFFANAFTFAGT